MAVTVTDDYERCEHPALGRSVEIRPGFDITCPSVVHYYKFSCDSGWRPLPDFLRSMMRVSPQHAARELLYRFDELRPFESSKSILLQ